MHLAGSLLAVATILFASSDALSTLSEVKQTTLTNLAAMKSIRSGDSTIGRVLRAHDIVDDVKIADGEDSEEEVSEDEGRTLPKSNLRIDRKFEDENNDDEEETEERAIPKLDRAVSEKFLSQAAAKMNAKLTRSKSLPKLALKTKDDALAAVLKDNKALFKKIDDIGYTPDSKLGIRDKLMKMPLTELLQVLEGSSPHGINRV